MPPKENQGNVPEQPNQAGQTPQQSAPLAESQPTAGQPDAASPTPTPAATPPQGKNPLSPLARYKKLPMIVAAAVVVIVLAALLLPFSPFSLFAQNVPKGPKMMVGDKNRFVYACGVLDADIVGKELDLNLDKTKQNAEETLAFDPSNTKDKSVDLIKQTSEKSVSSSCKIKFDRKVTTASDGKPVTSFINFSLFLEQFPGEKEAADKFKDSKDAVGKNAKSLASYGDSSYYVIPVKPKSGPTYLQPVLKYKNTLIYFTAPLKADDQQGEKMAGQLDTIAKDVIKRLEEKKGEQPKNISGVTQVGKNKFVDACQSVNYQKLAQALGGEVQFEPTSFTASHGYAPNDANGKAPNHVLSICGFDFRTKADADAMASQRPELPTDMSNIEESGYKSQYPHFAHVQILTVDKKEEAQKIITDAKKNGESQPDAPKIEDVKIGDVGIKVDVPHSDLNPYDNRFYYIAKGPHTYLFSISYKRQSQPFKTTDQNLTDEQAKKVFEVLEKASAYAQKK